MRLQVRCRALPWGGGWLWTRRATHQSRLDPTDSPVMLHHTLFFQRNPPTQEARILPQQCCSTQPRRPLHTKLLSSISSHSKLRTSSNHETSTPSPTSTTVSPQLQLRTAAVLLHIGATRLRSRLHIGAMHHLSLSLSSTLDTHLIHLPHTQPSQPPTPQHHLPHSTRALAGPCASRPRLPLEPRPFPSAVRAEVTRERHSQLRLRPNSRRTL